MFLCIVTRIWMQLTLKETIILPVSQN